jgi:hypothetical protein
VTWLWSVLATVAGGFAVDRLLIWCELQGWITWRLTPRPEHSFRGAAGHALLNLDAFFQPQTRHVVEMHIDAEVRRSDDEASDGSTRLKAAPDRGL